MKRLLITLTAVALLLSAAACSNNNTEPTITTTHNPSSTPAEDNITTTDSHNVDTSTTEANANPTDNSDFSALELIGYQYDDSLSWKYYVDTEGWQQLDDFALLRQYFFGSWENLGVLYGENHTDSSSPLVIDDSEKDFFLSQKIYHFVKFYKINENVLGWRLGSQAGGALFWIDINQPDIMYTEPCVSDTDSSYAYLYSVRENPESYTTKHFTKTDAKPNDPEDDNFLSIYKLHEMSKTYGIDIDMLMSIRCATEDGQVHFNHGNWDFDPVYLVSESADKLELKTTVASGEVIEDREKVNVTYTIEKINGEWVRTVEFEREDLVEITD